MTRLVPEPGAIGDSWTQIKTWRQQMREILIQLRIRMGGRNRRQLNEHIEGCLVRQLENFPPGTVGFYWPFKGEYDARELVKYLLDLGWKAALPAVVERCRPLEFRLWKPGDKLVPGIWKIPVPEQRSIARPDVLLIPVVGFDDALYRLGYGGGYYDITIAASDPKPFLIGIGYDKSRLDTIFPQEHDIPMDIVVTESGISVIED